MTKKLICIELYNNSGISEFGKNDNVYFFGIRNVTPNNLNEKKVAAHDRLRKLNVHCNLIVLEISYV